MVRGYRVLTSCEEVQVVDGTRKVKWLGLVVVQDSADGFRGCICLVRSC
jgi:hypothetical protein